MRVRVACAFLTAALVWPAAPAAADPGDVLVRFRAAAGADDRAEARRAAKVRRERGLPVGGLEVADPEPGVSAAAAAARLERDPAVLYAEPDAVRRALLVPDDRLFALEWGLDNTGQSVDGVSGTPDADVDAPEAWDVTAGASSVAVAVVDTGADVAHPDLAPNVWVNPGEIAGNGSDDDGNGLVDDVRGWDFVDGDATPQDGDGHGTHVAGTVGARGDDGLGVAGVAWRTAVMPLRVLGDDGSGSVSDVIRAYAYAAEEGARVVNLSLGGPDRSQAERDAIAARPGVLFVTAAGNEGADNDEVGSYPCNHDLPNLVCVAATDQDDELAPFSNRGSETVDLAAPGVSIASTYPRSRWAFMDGTSMAAPHVAGVAALLATAAPSPGAGELRGALLTGADQKASLAGLVATGARLNAFGALRALEAARSSAPDRDDGTGGTPAAEPAPPPPPPDTTTTPPPSETTAAPADPAPLVPRDVSAPFVRLSPSPSRDLRVLLRRRALRVRVACNEPCSARVELRRGARVLARATGPGTLRLRIGARERRRLRALRVARLTLRVRAADPAGNVRIVSRRLTLRR